METEVLIKAEQLSKKFAKSLKRSMVYGTAELFSNLVGIKPRTTHLRPREFWAVDHVDLEVKRGQVLGIIGHNGCGKTTLLRLLAGIYPPDDGKVTVQGRIAALISLGVGFHPHLTGYENIFLNGALLGMSTDEIQKKVDEIVEFAEIGEFINSPVANYSSGMRVRLGFSIAIATEPDILLLDEILAVGDRTFKAKSYKKIEQLSAKTASILISHNMQMVSRICSKIIVMESGRFIFESPDVAEGIEYYQQLKQVSEEGESGEGIIDLLSFHFWNKNNGQSGSWVQLRAADPMQINFSARINEPGKKIGSRFLIYDSDFNVVGETFSDMVIYPRQMGKDGDSQEEMNISVEFPRIYLRSGVYTLTLEFFDFATNLAIKSYHSVGTIQVMDNKIRRAMVFIEADWRMISTDGEGR